jgi:alkanesulfonate monooxygenase SsuD/methylene tetrahydromethanopterin reductase-like flavin-dependent oxidoreductase (luciferase family)
MRHAINLAPFGALADPKVIIEIGRAAEEHEWDGVFLWDHIQWPDGGGLPVADVWTALSAIAATTERVRLGPMVTPLPRRRVQMLAKQTVTLDHLSNGRLVFGLGSGGDNHRELSGFDEPSVERRELAARLDEGADLLVRLWSGEPVTHRGRYYTTDDARLLPPPVQTPRIPIWIATVGDFAAPVHRSVRFDGLFPINVTNEQIKRMIDTVASARGHLDGFDVAVTMTPHADAGAIEATGATWLMHSFWTDAQPEQVLRFLARGPHA